MSTPPTQPLSDAEKRQIDAQLDEVRPVAARYKTVADAYADGFVDPHIEEHGQVHLVRWDRMDDTFMATEPEMLLAEGRQPQDRVLALVYYDVTTRQTPPDGFQTDADGWHPHAGICQVNGSVAVVVPAETCALLDGRQIDGWMLHAWLVPGEDNPAGVFAESRPSSRPGG